MNCDDDEGVDSTSGSRMINGADVEGLGVKLLVDVLMVASYSGLKELGSKILLSLLEFEDMLEVKRSIGVLLLIGSTTVGIFEAFGWLCSDLFSDMEERCLEFVEFLPEGQVGKGGNDDFCGWAWDEDLGKVENLTGAKALDCGSLRDMYIWLEGELDTARKDNCVVGEGSELFQ